MKVLLVFVHFHTPTTVGIYPLVQLFPSGRVFWVLWVLWGSFSAERYHIEPVLSPAVICGGHV